MKTAEKRKKKRKLSTRRTKSRPLLIYHALKSNPDMWTQGDLAVDDIGDECDPNSPEAVQMCAIGLLDHFYGGSSPVCVRYSKAVDKMLLTIRKRKDYKQMAKARKIVYKPGIIGWNDHNERTVEQVTEAFLEAGL